MVEYTFLQINIISAWWTLVGILFARGIWNKEIKAYKVRKARED